ncbi:hypothetical protein D7X99_40480 [Corallococcus sp. AB032C]|nr:hypothetical protein D7X99_40480 [Corallococcus sp. AB032C]
MARADDLRQLEALLLLRAVTAQAGDFWQALSLFANTATSGARSPGRARDLREALAFIASTTA